MPHPGTPAVLQPTSGRGLKKKGGREKRREKRENEATQQHTKNNKPKSPLGGGWSRGGFQHTHRTGRLLFSSVFVSVFETTTYYTIRLVNGM